ncbi:dihydrofolate reductase family protein [Gordonia malaquae]|uniref:dihydrofolate reductase family protein n=1 Tax=Gordonia malaquae TaxID=410332 RepID=UPI003018971B
MFLMQKATDLTASELAELLAYPTSAGPVVRATFVSTIDGAATVDGRSGVLGGDGDRHVFLLMRTLSDTVVVGARTAVIENYKAPADDNAPVMVLASRSLDIPVDYLPVTHPRVLIATCTSAPADRRRRLIDAGATLIDCGDVDLDPRRLLDELGTRGLRRIDLEGGPRLFASFVAAGAVDELILTTSPTLGLGDAPRIAHGATLPLPDQDLPLPDRLPYPMSLVRQFGDDDGYLYSLWSRRSRAD